MKTPLPTGAASGQPPQSGRQAGNPLAKPAFPVMNTAPAYRGKTRIRPQAQKRRSLLAAPFLRKPDVQSAKLKNVNFCAEAGSKHLRTLTQVERID